jgi:hemoglobin
MRIRLPVVLCACAILSLVGCATQSAATASTSGGGGNSLYDRLGGVWAISQVVNDFMDRLVQDKVVMANAQVAATGGSSPLPYLKYQVTAMVCEATGGPCKYAGKNMKDSHVHLKITAAEWDAMVADMVFILEKYKVPTPEKTELLTILGSTRADIVTVN